MVFKGNCRPDSKIETGAWREHYFFFLYNIIAVGFLFQNRLLANHIYQ